MFRFLFHCNIVSLVYNLNMNRLTNEQHQQIIEFYYQNACSVKKVHCAFPPVYGQFNRSTEATIRTIVTKFRTKFTLLATKPPTRLRRMRTEENMAAVSARVNDDHQLSIRSRSQPNEPLLLQNVENFTKGFRCEAFHNIWCKN